MLPTPCRRVRLIAVLFAASFAITIPRAARCVDLSPMMISPLPGQAFVEGEVYQLKQTGGTRDVHQTRLVTLVR